MIGKYKVSNELRRERETKIVIDRRFNGTDDKIWLRVGKLYFPIPDGDGAYTLALPIVQDDSITERLHIVNMLLPNDVESGKLDIHSSFRSEIRSVTMYIDDSERISNVRERAKQQGKYVMNLLDLYNRLAGMLDNGRVSVEELKALKANSYLVAADKFPADGVYVCGSEDYPDYKHLSMLQCGELEIIDSVLQDLSVEKLGSVIDMIKSLLLQQYAVLLEYRDYFVTAQKASEAVIDQALISLEQLGAGQ